jgi:ABC-type molybdate transport system substrate-binding protein
MIEPPAIRILSAGAPITGVHNCAEANANASGKLFEIERATSPVIKERVGSGTAEAEIVVAPLAAMEEFASAGHVEPQSVCVIGSITLGVVIRNGARESDISSVESFTQAVLGADRVIYNLASSGQYIAATLAKLGLTDKIAAKTIVVPNGAAVMERLVEDASLDDIGFGQITEIRRHDHLGTHLMGPLPEAIGRQTPYAVGLLTSAFKPEIARRLVDFMVSSEGKRIFVASGVV